MQIQHLIELFLEALNTQIMRFDSAILDQQRLTIRGEELYVEMCSRQSEMALTPACLNSPALIALQREDISTLKDCGETAADFEETSSAGGTQSRAESISQDKTESGQQGRDHGKPWSSIYYRPCR